MEEGIEVREGVLWTEELVETIPLKNILLVAVYLCLSTVIWHDRLFSALAFLPE